MRPSDADLALNAASAWIGPVRARALLSAFGSAEAVLKASPSELRRPLPRLGADAAGAMAAFLRAFDPQAERAQAESLGCSILKLGGPGYPAALAGLPDAPLLLYVRGSLPPPEAACIAIVGTRTPSDYGRQMARRLAQGLARAGVWIVSGLARGIDAEAHAACLEAGGKTLAVQGRGLGAVYPASNRGLGERIPAQGALLSQFSLQTGSEPMHFPMRNAVISGLSRGVLVVEGESDSGSLITADFALEQGREVFAVPGPADAPMSQGPLDLIAQGARMVRSAEDMLDELGLLPPRPRGRRQAVLPGLEAAEAAPPDPGLDPASAPGRLWGALSQGPCGLDELGARCGLAAGELAAAMTELELIGAVRQLPGARLERSLPG